jgi:hypothetical protein
LPDASAGFSFSPATQVLPAKQNPYSGLLGSEVHSSHKYCRDRPKVGKLFASNPMRPKVVVALPAKCSSSVKDHIERGLREKHPFIDFDFKDDANIKCPQARGLEPNGVNLGTINGDPVKALTAQIEGFHREANELFRIGLEREES